MIAVNFFGGAGIGKSTIAAEVFARLKALGVNAELVGEMAKDVILQNNFSALEDHLWLFANQAHRMRGMAQMGVKVAVCDSPLPLSLIYGAARDVDDNQTFSDLVWQEFDKYQNINFILERQDNFWRKAGRADDETFALRIDQQVYIYMADRPWQSITPYDGDIVVDTVLKILEEDNDGKFSNAKEGVA